MPVSRDQAGKLDPSTPVFFPNQQQSHEQQADNGRRASINALTENSSLRRSARLRERAQSVPSDQAPIVTASSEQAHSSQQTTGDGALSEQPTSQQQDNNGDQNQMPSLAEVELDIADDVSAVGNPGSLNPSVNMSNYETMAEINDNNI